MAKRKLPADFVETANERFEEAKRFWTNWKGEARDSYAFISGDQWLASDITILNEQKRPPITFNYSEKMIDAVVGAEVSNRQEVTYKPRELRDSPLAELWTNAAKWVRDTANIDDEETDAFRDCLICGMGWTHTRVSYEVDADGMVETNRKDPIDMIADPSAVKPGLLDRRYSFCLEWINESEAKRQWPGTIAFSTENETARGIDHIRHGHRYEGDEADDPDLHHGQVQIRHYECVELEPYYRVAASSQIIEVEAGEFARMKDQLDERNITYIKQYRRVYYYAYFAGDTLLEGDVSPTQEGFTYQCITGKRDRNKNTWYGLTRVMKDPARWANKWLSQILHIINTNAKGGLMAEVGAFVDPQKAQDEWSMPESITLLREGGISKIKEKQMTTYPSGLDRLMEFALSSLPQVTGINLEALGLAGREQANVLEQSRKQAAYGLLAPVFDSLRRYRKAQGRVMLDFINNYISDGRLVRIGGPESQQFLPLTKAPNAPRYDIIVDQSPQAPDVKSKTWEVLVQILPHMMKAGLPIPPSLLDYAPVPSNLSLDWKKAIQQNAMSPEKVQQMQQQMQKMQQDMQKMQQALQDKSQEMQIEERKAAHEMKLKEQKFRHDMQMDEAEVQSRMVIEKARVDSERQLAQYRTSADIEGNMMKIQQSGETDFIKMIFDSVNKLNQTIAKLEAEEEAEKQAAKTVKSKKG
jgi:hypothetical protein